MQRLDGQKNSRWTAVAVVMLISLGSLGSVATTAADVPGAPALRAFVAKPGCEDVPLVPLQPTLVCGHVFQLVVAPSDVDASSVAGVLLITLGAPEQGVVMGVGMEDHNLGLQITGQAGANIPISLSLRTLDPCNLEGQIGVAGDPSTLVPYGVGFIVYSEGPTYAGINGRVAAVGLLPPEGATIGVAVKNAEAGCTWTNIVHLTGGNQLTRLRVHYNPAGSEPIVATLYDMAVETEVLFGTPPNSAVTRFIATHDAPAMHGTVVVGDATTISLTKAPREMLVDVTKAAGKLSILDVRARQGLAGGSVAVAGNTPDGLVYSARISELDQGRLTLDIPNKNLKLRNHPSVTGSDRVTFLGAGSLYFTADGIIDQTASSREHDIFGNISAPSIRSISGDVSWGDTIGMDLEHQRGSAGLNARFTHQRTNVADTPTVVDVDYAPTDISFTVNRDSARKVKAVSATFSGGATATRIQASGAMELRPFDIGVRAVTSGHFIQNKDAESYDINMNFVAGAGFVDADFAGQKDGRNVEMTLKGRSLTNARLIVDKASGPLGGTRDFLFVGSKMVSGGYLDTDINVKVGGLTIERDPRISRSGNTYTLDFPNKLNATVGEGQCASRSYTTGETIFLASTSSTSPC